MALSLLHHARIWLQNRFRASPSAGALHDGLEDSLAAVDTDQAAAEAATIIGEAGADGLNRWGIDLDEVRLPSQSDAQYTSALAAVYQGAMVDPESGAAILAKYGITGAVVDRGYPAAFADLAFADSELMTLEGPPNYAHFACLFDSWPGTGSGVLLESDWNQRCINASTNLFRIKASGVRFTPFLPLTTPLG